MSLKDTNPWALYYEDDAYTISGSRIMGRQAAGNSLLKAFARSDYTNIGVYASNPQSLDSFNNEFRQLIPSQSKKSISYIPWGNPSLLSNFGGLYYPAPDISRFINQRFFNQANSYSVVGITHTTASQNAIDSILDCYTTQLMPWDALICTSKSVKNSIDNLYQQYSEILKNRIGATKMPNFELPIIPLGVHTEDYNFSKQEKDQSRQMLGIKSEDIVILFLGRLSFHAKAHHVPMYIALEKVKKSLPKNVNLHLIQTGWFPNDTIEKIYKEESKILCPSIQCHFLDGRDVKAKRVSFSSSDIFISLVDNFQETFGLTPLEGMSAGLPVIVSDWNGYKDTVRDGLDGFKIPTTTLQEGSGYDLALRHNLGIDTYDHYIGRASQTVSVNIKETYKKILELCLNKDLRIKMGESAKERSKDYNWQKILLMYQDLKNELDAKRTKSAESNEIFLEPISIQDPYTFFNDYSSFKINDETIIEVNDKLNTMKIDDFYKLSSISFLDKIAPEVDEIKKIHNFILNSNHCLISDIESAFEFNYNEIFKTIIWLSKYGYINIKEKINE